MTLFDGINLGTEAPDPWYFERLLHGQGLFLVAGVDEVGRGCLAGPVVAAAVILSEDLSGLGITDSKAISAKERERLDGIIRQQARSVSVAEIGPDEIDRGNILKASLEAMRLAVQGLEPAPNAVLVDGNQPIPGLVLPQKTIVKGDSRSCSIAAASIVAKVYRDRLMMEYHRRWPQYGFDSHKGYGTARHRQALVEYGPCPIHRLSFKGVVSESGSGPNPEERMDASGLGREGEEIGAAFMERLGCRILDRNFRTRYGEIDLVVECGDEIVFVEVKTRSGLGRGRPEEAVTTGKAARLRQCALAWLTDRGLEEDETTVRFDVLAIELAGNVWFDDQRAEATPFQDDQGRKYLVTHIPDAF